MPDMSQTVNISPDGRYVFATGGYKPVLKCYDLQDLSVKFERGIDSDIIKVIMLSDDFSKFVILEDERYLEMHATFGRYFRMRMPRYGRDMDFSKECSDLYLVGASSEIYRLNLEQGEWLSPLQTQSSGSNCCQFADQNQLFVCGTTDGTVEAWDHRDKNRVGILDCAVSLLEQSGVEVTSVKFRDALHLYVGTSSGHILLYDLRSSVPMLVKDHYNGLPIRKMEYVARDDGDLVLSMDDRVLKMWNEETGAPFAAIETEAQLTDFCRYPNSGLLFFSNVASRMQQFFVPSLGPAPKWCSFLETITEELEETDQPSVYEDYKFVTAKQLEEVGMSHLIGSNVLRAYMHGYFVDVRLYNKAATLTQPFAYDKYKDRKVQEIIDEERESKAVKKEKKKLPKVNQELAIRLQEEADAEESIADMANGRRKLKGKKKAAAATSLLTDSRFSKLFDSEDFTVDETSNEFLLSTAGQPAKKTTRSKKKATAEVEPTKESDEENEILPSVLGDDEDVQHDSSSGSEDSDADNVKKVRAKEKAFRKEQASRAREEKYLRREEKEEEEKLHRLANKPKKFVLHDLAAGETTRKFLDGDAPEAVKRGESESLAQKRRRQKKSGQLGYVEETAFGGRAISFKLESGASARAAKELKNKEEHQKERKELVRAPTQTVTKGLKKLPGNVNTKTNRK